MTSTNITTNNTNPMPNNLPEFPFGNDGFVLKIDEVNYVFPINGENAGQTLRRIIPLLSRGTHTVLPLYAKRKHGSKITLRKGLFGCVKFSSSYFGMPKKRSFTSICTDIDTSAAHAIEDTFLPV